MGNPFQPAPDAIPIEEGRQGGYHIEVSIRVTGAIDPDAVDIAIKLSNAERVVATHVQEDWLLRIDRESPSCWYPVALLALLDDEGGFLQPADFAEIRADMRVEVALRSPAGDAFGDFPVRLVEPPPESE